MPETIGELQTGYLDSISNIDTNKSIIKLIISYRWVAKTAK